MTNANDATLKKYYSLRSRDYDLLYEKPERQDDLRKMEGIVLSELSGKRVLEIACGSGYWTALLSSVAESVHGIDTSPEMLEIAMRRTSDKENVILSLDDTYSLQEVEGDFNAAFLGYWISHVERKRMYDYLCTLGKRLPGGSRVVMLDNRYVDGSSTPISRTDPDGNTYQLSNVQDGKKFEIVKNFLDEDELRRITPEDSRDIRYWGMQFYWVYSYST